MVDLAAASEHLLATRAWSQAGLDSFDHVTTESRRTLRETTLEGLDVTEVKYRIDAPGRKTAEAFGVSCSKPPTDLATLKTAWTTSAPATPSGPPTDTESATIANEAAWRVLTCAGIARTSLCRGLAATVGGPLGNSGT